MSIDYPKRDGGGGGECTSINRISLSSRDTLVSRQGE